MAYIDAHYRTIPQRLSRGLVGHSMGGYGATRIGMKHADVFGSLYIMSPGGMLPFPVEQVARELENVKTLEEAAKLPFMMHALLAMAAAWSPNPNKPPFYLDLPTKDGEVQHDVIAKWTANAALAMIDQYIGNLRQYSAIAIDVGDQDWDWLRADTEKLHEVLDEYGIEHEFEVYEGTHTSKVDVRFQTHVMPFFSQNLSFKAGK